MVQKRNTPSERAKAWNAAHIEARKNGATRVESTAGEAAKYAWLRLIASSGLPATSRLVAHTLCLHGRKDGTNIFPSTACLAKESGLTERAICTHLEQLVRSGWLWRVLKNPNREGKGWASTLFLLCAPENVLQQFPERAKPWEVDPSWTPDDAVNGTEPASVPKGHRSQGTERPSVPTTQKSPKPRRMVDETRHGTEPQTQGTERQTVGTERHTDGTEPDVKMALNDVQRSLKSGVFQRVSQGVTQSECAPARTLRDNTLIKIESEKGPGQSPPANAEQVAVVMQLARSGLKADQIAKQARPLSTKTVMQILEGMARATA